MKHNTDIEVITRLTLPLLLLWSLTTPPAMAEQSADPRLKQRLIDALSENENFLDRFDAEVWLLDMSSRLARVMPNERERFELLRLLHSEAARTELPPELVLAVIQVESNFDRFAISEAGARGLMQVMPFWLDELGRPGDNLFDVQTNLRFGCTILRYYLDMEKGNRTRALARYNGSLGSYRYPNLVYTALRTKWFR